MSSHGSQEGKHSFITQLVYSSPINAFCIHFTAYFTVGFLFALITTKMLHLPPVGARWAFFLFESAFLGLAALAIRKIASYRGFLIKFWGEPTHIIIQAGYWPLLFFPLFEFEEREVVSFEKQDIVIPRSTVLDSRGNSFYLDGIIKWSVDGDKDVSKFTGFDYKAFLALVARRGLQAATTVTRLNSYSLKNSTDPKILLDTVEFNEAILTKMDTPSIANEYDVTINETLFMLTCTEKTMDTLQEQAAAEEEAKANAAKTQAVSTAIQDYMTKFNCSFEDARKAVSSAINGEENINISGAGGNNAVPLIHAGSGNNKKN